MSIGHGGEPSVMPESQSRGSIVQNKNNRQRKLSLLSKYSRPLSRQNERGHKRLRVCYGPGFVCELYIRDLRVSSSSTTKTFTQNLQREIRRGRILPFQCTVREVIVTFLLFYSEFGVGTPWSER